MINYKDYWDQKVDVKLIWFDECFWDGMRRINNFGIMVIWFYFRLILRFDELWFGWEMRI